jgi:hypothetical protein
MFAAILITILLIVLWLPSWLVLKFAGRLSATKIIRKAWLVWLAQICLAVVLVFLTDVIGFTNPAGYTFGICLGIGVLGGRRCCGDSSRRSIISIGFRPRADIMG